MRKIIYLLAALALAVTFLASARTAYADVLFEHELREERGGVVYERIRQMTTNGMLDVHVLTVPLNDPNIYIGPVVSQQAHGRKDTATNLLSDVNAVAGINADFFGLAGRYSVHFGPMAMDGELLGLNPHTNRESNEFAAFFLDTAGNPFFNYMRADVRFYNNGVANVHVSSLNVIGLELHSPVIIDRRLMNNTAQLFDRFNGLTKFVVQGDRVTRVSQGIVDVPVNGYVLVLPPHMYESHRHLINAGDSARLHVSNNLNIDFSRIQTAIGGGGLILSGGETMYGRGVAPNARHPRSAIGVTQDGNSLILMVVDGRTHSIGATHAEMADWLRRFGAWDAMHFDGGGSSTMVLREVTGAYTVANTPSDGAERRIINALGVFDRRPFVPIYIPIPQLAELRSHPASISLFSEGQQMNLRFSGVGVDGNYVANVPISNVSAFTVVPPELGTIEDGVFTAGSGRGYIIATVHGVNTYIPVTIGGTSRALDILVNAPSFVGYPGAYVDGEAGLDGHNLWLEYGFLRSSVTQAAHLALYPVISLPNNTIAINMLVEGNSSGHWLRGRVRDGSGQLHNIDFVRYVDFYYWTLVTAALPVGAPGPFVLDRIYMVTVGSDVTDTFRIQFGGLEAIVAHAPPENVPVGPVFRDMLWAEQGFVGVSAGNNFSFALPYAGYEVEYETRSEGPFSVTTMTLYGGRLGAEQWAQFMTDIRSTNPSYVVILLDRNPRTAFRHSMEFELLHLALTELQSQGRRVFVVSATAAETTVLVRDGIRYINLTSTNDYIHFRVADEIRWSD